MPFTIDAMRAAGSPGTVVSAARRGPLALRNLGIVALLFAAGIAMSFGFSLVGLEPEASFLLFIVGILIASLETDSGLWGIVLGVMYLLVYDLFFALPHLSLLIFNWTDAVTLVIFAVVALITGALTNRMKQQVEIAERNALVLRRLNKISAGLIDSTSAEGACAFASDALCRVLGRKVSISLGRPDGDGAALECFEQGYQTGAGAGGPADCTSLYVPLAAKAHVYGVVTIDCSEGGLDKAGRSFLDSAIKQTVIAVERNNLEEHARADELKIERERFKTTLLRSVSHDLRTPLASIQGNAEFLKDNCGQVGDAEREALLSSMASDARWLAEMIDNLLGMTRVQDEDVPLDFQPEVVDDIIGDAVMHEMPYREGHEITVKPPDDVVLVPMDGKLIRQVLINLIDNAIKHSAPQARIVVSSEVRDGKAVFRVADSDGGIAPDMLGKVFSRFVSEGAGSGRKSGIGLGLSICQAIVEAHGGGIGARNNDEGGATFEFWLPLERPADEAAADAGLAAESESPTGTELAEESESLTGARLAVEPELGRLQPQDPQRRAGKGAQDGR